MPDQDSSEPPKRRPRYRTTHPRRFEQKYKELDPIGYPDEARKVRARGRTPAGSHVPVLLDEVLAALAPRRGEVGLDATLGRGGHATELARRVAPGGRVIGLDLDAEELARTEELLAHHDVPVHARHGNFAGVAKVLAAEQLAAVDFFLADLGVSSMQLDRPERGFSFKHDAPLDLRMDRTRGRPAADLLAVLGEEELAAILARHGNVPDAVKLAASLVARREANRPVTRTRELTEAVLRLRGLDPKSFRQDHPYDSHPAAPVFQALRVAVNREHENLAALLRDLPWIVKSGGRVAIISFHSGEDAAVAMSFEDGAAAGLWRGVRAPVVPSRDEMSSNPRARSARLRAATRV